MMQPFKPVQYHDQFQDRLRKLVEAKRRGQTVEVEEAAKRAPVIDMMQALKKSLASRSTAGAETKKFTAKHRKVASKVRKAS
jgi:DNA end-binding protein Ku